MSEPKRGILADWDSDDEDIADLMNLAIADALRLHKEHGAPIATWDWEANRVVLVPPEEIVVPGDAPAGGGAEPVRNGSQAAEPPSIAGDVDHLRPAPSK